jgi:hypothetical protein
MAQIIQRVEAGYEAREVPFGKTYEWHPACIALECEEKRANLHKCVGGSSGSGRHGRD